MKEELNKEIAIVEQSLALARSRKPVYSEWYSFLERLFLLQVEEKHALTLDRTAISREHVATRWQEGFPLLNRWDFPVDIEAAERILTGMTEHAPKGNASLKTAHSALCQALGNHPDRKEDIWGAFLHHEGELWDEWIDADTVELAALIFWARACLRPSLEWTSEDLLKRFSLPDTWLKGYCPVCGSLPALLLLHKEGARRAYCSWCGAMWDLHRLQCPYCDNRFHESLGYLAVEDEPIYRIQYCTLCKMYFKLIDTRELLEPPYFPLEEWTTLHLDLVAQNEGWKQPPSPSPVVYGKGA